jgi:polyvinyl alcohol dehydrogenase (cytochrome)
MHVPTRSTRVRLGLAIGAAVLAVPLIAFAAQQSGSWPSGGQNISDTHGQPNETAINANNVKSLAVKWTAQVHGDVSAIPAVVDGAVYVPDWGGYLNKLDANTGAVIWSKPIDSYEPPGVPAGAVSRASPAVVGNTVYLGDQNGGHLFAVNATNGDPVWTTTVDPAPADAEYALLTAGPLVYNGIVYQGLASAEEQIAGVDPTYPCCTFRGSVTAMDAATGKVLWRTYTVPDNHGQPGGYSGGGVWGTTPAIDPASNTLFITTGNNYSVPPAVDDCQTARGKPGSCLSPDDHVDSIMALDAATGRIKWTTNVQGFDTWNYGCIPGFPPDNCPTNPGPEYDFGSGPNLFTVGNGKNAKLMVGAGQKSGTYWALDAQTGQILWSTTPGPGSTFGGIEWGSATDGNRVYVAEENYNGIPYQLPSGETITSGSWAALNLNNGKVAWQVADPSHNAFGGGNALGPVSVANGIVFVPSMDGTMRALSAGNGKTLWSYQAAGSVNTGAVVVNGVVYWGSGYTHLGIPGWTGRTTFYAFSINGK